VLSGEIEPGDKVTVDVLERELRFDAAKGGAAQEAETTGAAAQ
jgi:hypothetical protein